MENSPDAQLFHLLEYKADTNFIKDLLKECQVDAEADALLALLDILYACIKQKLIEAKGFAALLNKQSLDVSDFRIAKIEKIDEYRAGPMRLSSLRSNDIPKPQSKTSLLLPPWRNCQVGASIELKIMQPHLPAADPVKPTTSATKPI